MKQGNVRVTGNSEGFHKTMGEWEREKEKKRNEKKITEMKMWGGGRKSSRKSEKKGGEVRRQKGEIEEGKEENVDG